MHRGLFESEETSGERFDLALDLLTQGESVVIAGFVVRVTVGAVFVSIPSPPKISERRAREIFAETDAWLDAAAEASSRFRAVAGRPRHLTLAYDMGTSEWPICTRWNEQVRWPVDEGPDPLVASVSREPLTVEPVLVGGMNALHSRIRYPASDVRAGRGGRVVVQFVVGTDGVPSSIRVTESASRHLDAEVVRAVAEARFTPGRQNGAAVAVPFTLPVTFRVAAP